MIKIIFDCAVVYGAYWFMVNKMNMPEYGAIFILLVIAYVASWSRCQIKGEK
jgi:hypothetical protein